jgi:hypothetical protein
VSRAQEVVDGAEVRVYAGAAYAVGPEVAVEGGAIRCTEYA